MSNLPPGCDLSQEPGQYDPPSDVWILTDEDIRMIYPFSGYSYSKLAESHGDEKITVGTWEL